MTSLLALTATLLVGQSQFQSMVFTGPGETVERFRVWHFIDRQNPPKKSPKQKWDFEWLTAAYGAQNPELGLAMRFRVFNQMRRETNDLSPLVARMALRMWDFNVRRLRLEHSELYNRGIIDFYLCFGGEAGGEQLFDEEVENGIARKVNTIYIYQIQSFQDPVEMAREVAHEYGHATLPPVGGFETPEEWGNGYLGEKLYLRWIRDEMRAKTFTPADAMGAELAGLDAWVKKNVDPLWTAAAANGPNMALLAGKGQNAMDAYLGLALYAELLLPREAFARSLKLTGSVQAKDYPDAIALAACEVPTRTLNVPASFVGKPMWIPMVQGSKVSGAAAKKRAGNWVQVVPQGRTIRLTNPEL